MVVQIPSVKWKIFLVAKITQYLQNPHLYISEYTSDEYLCSLCMDPCFTSGKLNVKIKKQYVAEEYFKLFECVNVLMLYVDLSILNLYGDSLTQMEIE